MSKDIGGRVWRKKIKKLGRQETVFNTLEMKIQTADTISVHNRLTKVERVGKRVLKEAPHKLFRGEQAAQQTHTARPSHSVLTSLPSRASQALRVAMKLISSASKPHVHPHHPPCLSLCSSLLFFVPWFLHVLFSTVLSLATPST